MLTAEDTALLEGQSGFDGSFDLGDTDSSDLDVGGIVDREGWYHFEVADVVPELETHKADGEAKSPCIRFDLSVLHSVPGQSKTGARLFHRVWVGSKGGGPPAEGSIKSAKRFGLGLGVLRQIEHNGKRIVVDSVTGQTRITKETWLRAKGQQCIGRVARSKEDKTGQYDQKFELPFGQVYPVDHPEVADVPKNVNALALIGKASLAAAPAKVPPTATTNSTSPPAAQPVAAAPSGGGWDNIADL
jgi:hypothetical protein